MAAYTTIDDSGLFINPILYTGDSSSTRSLTGVGFQPDLVWVKTRNASNPHLLSDAVRGTNNNLASDSTAAEAISYAQGWVSAFGADGYTAQAGGSGDNDINGNTNTYVAWNWKAGTTTGITTDGNTTITPSGYSFNATSGFSCIAYTGNGTGGAKYPHGLGVTPAMVITKQLDSTNSWYVFQQKMSSTPSNTEMYLNTTDAAPASTGNGITPDTVNIDLEGTSASTNGNTNTYIAYIFAEISGYSKFGKWIGNGNADGSFVYTGFRPSVIISKSTGYAENWFIFDNKRPGYNFNANLLNPNSTTTETTDGANGIDIYSNGFKMRTTNNGTNRSADTFIYAAWAEAPFVNSNGVPCNAR